MLSATGLPGWAKLVASTVVGCILLLGVFVTRAEFNALSGRLDTMQTTLNQVLWRVGGPQQQGAEDLTPITNVPCVWEEALPAKGRTVLDHLWREAQLAAEKPTCKKRPRFCFAPQPIMTFLPDKGPGLLYGLYTPERNDALVAINPANQEEFRCIIIHEMIHALRGTGHANFPAYLAKAGCEED
jgi:hypothetical protein